MVMVAVMDRQFLQLVLSENPPAAGADMGKQRQGLLPVFPGPRFAGLPGVGNNPIEFILVHVHNHCLEPRAQAQISTA